MTPRLTLVALAVLSGCARTSPNAVAEGVARLTVRDLGGVLIAANNDEACGFSSAEVIDNPAVSGGLGETGTATWTVSDCVIDLGDEPVELSTDCNDVITTATGQFTVTARKVVTGRYTGDPATPVIPEAPDAATFFIDDVSFSNFAVMKSNSDSHMTILEGSLEAAVTPMLARDWENQACSVITPHIAFDDIEWGAAEVEITSGKKVFEVPIANGSLDATNGVVGEHENRVEGSLHIWNKPREVALSGLEDGLDPDYDPQTLEDSFTCNEDLAEPLAFTCPLEPVLAENAARLIIKNYGLISKTVDLDTDCGFGSLMEQVSELISFGALAGLFTGDPETIEINADACTVGGDMFPIFTDCLDAEYFLDGTATVTGVKTVTGKIVLSTDPLQPQDRESALVELDRVLVDELTPLERPAGTVDFEPHLTLHGGVMSGTYHPITGEAADAPGAYFIVIPVGEFENVRLQNSNVTLRNGDMSFPMHIDDTQLYAFTGGYLEQSNWLYGSVTINGETYEVGSSTAPVALDPDYDQAAFDASYVCLDNLRDVVPVD